MFRMVSHENTREYDETRSEHPEKALFLNKKGRKKGEKVVLGHFHERVI